MSAADARPVADHPADPGQVATSHAHFPCFDGLRAIAAMVVLLHHAGFQVGKNSSGWASRYLSRMDVGVAIFFAISGFLLYRPFVARSFAEQPTLDVRSFWWRRALRIFPAYWAALTLSILFFGVRVTGGIKGYAAHYALVHVYTSRRIAVGGLNQSWTLAVEISFYLFIPLYAFVMRRLGARRSAPARLQTELLGLGALIIIAQVSRIFVFAGPFDYVHKLGEYWLPTNLDWFAAGMLLAVVSAWVSVRTVTATWLDRVGELAVLWWALAALAFFVVCHLGFPLALTPLSGKQFYVRQVLFGLTAFFLLVPAVFGPAERGPVRRFLRWAPVAYVGLVSYGLYLWHQPWIHQAVLWMRFPTFQGSLAALLTVAFAWSLILASLSYTLLERPVLRWKTKLPAVFRRRDGS